MFNLNYFKGVVPGEKRWRLVDLYNKKKKGYSIFAKDAEIMESSLSTRIGQMVANGWNSRTASATYMTCFVCISHHRNNSTEELHKGTEIFLTGCSNPQI